MNQQKIKIVLDDKEIKKTLKIKDVINVVEEGFRKKGLGLIDLPPKMGPKLNISGAFAESMPVSVFDTKKKLELFGVKWQSAYKSNLEKNISYLNNLVILNEPQSGLPIAVLSGNWITAIRTAGVSAVSAKYLAPEKKDITIGIFGLGLQAYVHVLAFKEIFKKPKFFLFNHGDEFLKPFLKKLPKEKFEISKNSHNVVQNSDVILSATTFPDKITPYIFAQDLKNDILILPLDYGTRVSPALYEHLDAIYTDDIPQYNLKSKLRHYFPTNRPEIKKEIGDIVSQNIKRKNIPQKILVFNLGIALFDILVAKLFLEKSRDKS